MTRTPPRVQIVNKPTSPHTGIGRFALEIERGLIQRGIMLSIAPLHDLVPRPVTNVVKKFGLDLDAFFKSYPLRVDARQGHVTHLTSQSLGILLLTQRFSRPVVVTVHDILPYLLRDDQQLNVYGHHAQRIMDALAMRGLRRADRLTADSLFTKSTLMDALEIPETLIDVVPLGVDTSHFQPQSVPDSFRQKHQLPRDRVFALYVGTEDPRKNLPLLLRAIRQARETLPNLTLLKVGAAAFANQRERHVKLAHDLGISDSVLWFNDVSEEDLPLFYNLASVFVFPSLHEGFGFPLLESLACGTPVVAFRSSSIPELVSNPEFLVDTVSPQAFAMQMTRSLSRNYSRWSVEEMALHARRYTWETTVTRTLDTYSTALNSNEAIAWTSAS